jgi:hypothetical protein
MPVATLRLAVPLLACSLLCGQEAQQTDQKLDLKVLYAGVPDHARTEAWRAFLAPRTLAFTVVDAAQFTEADAASADVVVLDCPDPIRKDDQGRPTRIDVPRPKQLTAAFDRPTIVIASMAIVTDRLDLKANWL